MADTTAIPPDDIFQGPKATGVYGIRNKVNGKCYVGSTAKSFRERWWQHRTDLRRHKHVNRHLQSAWNKHGESAFEFSVLELCLPEECVAREQFWIDLKQAANREFGYNLAPNAGNSLGVKQSPETCAKNGAAKRGRKASVETRAKMSLAQKGRKHTPESIAKMSVVQSGKVMSAEARVKIGTSSRGRKHTAETKAKIGEASRTRSPEVNARIAAANRGRKRSPEACARIGAGVRANGLSPEGRAKLAAMARERNFKRRGTKYRAKVVASQQKRRLAEQETDP